MENTSTQAIINNFSKKHKNLTITTLGKLNLNQAPYSTGILNLDHVLGGGFRPRKIHEIYGVEGSGKTMLVALAVAHIQKTQKANKAVVYDAENAWDNEDWLKFLGVDTDNLIYIRGCSEDAMDAIVDLAKDPSIGIFVIDSVAAMVTKQELAHDMEEREVANTAGLLGKFFKKYLNNCTNSCLVLINQVREAIGAYNPYGTTVRTPGGRPIRHYASIRLEVVGSRKDTTEIKGDQKIIKGLDVKFKAIKSRAGTEGRSDRFRFWFDSGVDHIDGIFRLGKQSGLIKSAGPWVSGEVGDKEFRVMGFSQFQSWVQDRPETIPMFNKVILEKTDRWRSEETFDIQEVEEREFEVNYDRPSIEVVHLEEDE